MKRIRLVSTSALHWHSVQLSASHFAGNLITLFVFYEILTLITYPLVTHQGTDKARQGGRVYLAFLLGTSVMFLLPAIVFTWYVAGTTDFRPGGILAGQLAPAALAIAPGTLHVRDR